MTAIPSPESLILLAVLVAVRRRADHSALPQLAESARDGDAGDRRRAVSRRVLPARARARRRAAAEPMSFEVAPGLELAFEVEPLGMLFALVASVAVDRQFDLFDRLHARQSTSRGRPDSMSASPSRSAARSASPSPRTCSRCSCSTRRLTLSTYPLVTHKQNAEAMRAGRLYLLLLLGTSLVLFLPAIVATWVLAGTLDFTPGGILAGKAGAPVIGVAARALRLRHRQGGGHAAAFLAAGGHGGADAGQRAAARGGGGQGRRLHHPQGRRAHLRHRDAERHGPIALAHGRRRHDRDRRLARRAAAGQPEAPARLFDRLAALLCRARRRDPDADLGGRRRHAHRRACGEQDHAVLRRRLDPHRRAPDRGEPARRHRPPHAVDHGRLRDRRARHDRHAADRGLSRQMVHPDAARCRRPTGSRSA